MIIKENGGPRSGRAWIGLGIVAAALAARSWHALARPLWFDELFTLWIARQPPAAIVRALRLDSGPPLFYLVETPFVRLGELLRSDAAARILSFLSLAALFLAGVRRETSGGRRFLVLLAASPLLFFYSAEARPYALLAALSFLLFLAVFRMRRSRARTVLAGASALLLPWVHYLGGLVVAGSVLLAFARRRRGLALLQAAAAAPFAAWLPVALRQPAAALSWSGESFASSVGGTLGVFGFWARVPGYFSRFAAPLPLAGAALGAVLVALAAIEARRDRAVRDALLFAALPLLFAAAAGLRRPVWFAGRTEMAVLPVVLWAFARAARRSRPLRLLTSAAASAGTVVIAASLAARPAPPPYSISAAYAAGQASRADAVVASDADYLPLRLAADRGALAAPLLGIPAAIESHPGWFEPGKLPDPAAESARLEGFLGGLPPGGRVYFAVPPDPAPRGLVAPHLAGNRVTIATPPGGDAIAVLAR